MEIKILCTCGAKYKFDIEPVNNQLPGTVQCPACGVDGTAAGNAAVAAQLSVPTSAPAQMGVRPPNASSAPQPALANKGSGSGFVVPTIARSSKEHLALQGAPASSDGDAQVAISPVVPPSSSAAPAPRPREYSGPSNVRGIIGAGVAGVIGMIVWTVLTIVTNTEIGWVAWGVGVFVGYGAKLFAKGQSNAVALAAAGAALVAILAGQFFATRHSMNSFLNAMVEAAYEGHVAYAKEAVAVKNDAEIRALLAKQEAEDDSVGNPEAITAAQISEFKMELPNLKRAASGQMSKAEYQREHELSVDTGFILKNSFSLFTLLWIALGVGSAYRISNSV